MTIAIVSQAAGLGHVEAAYFEAVTQDEADLADLARELGARGAKVSFFSRGTRAKGEIRGVMHYGLGDAGPGDFPSDLVVATPSLSRLLCKDVFGASSKLIWLVRPGDALGLIDENTYVLARGFAAAAAFVRSGVPRHRIVVQPQIVPRDFHGAPAAATGPLTFLFGSQSGWHATSRVADHLKQAGYGAEIAFVNCASRLGEDRRASLVPEGLVAASPAARAQWLAALGGAGVVACFDDALASCSGVVQDAMGLGRPVVAPQSPAFSDAVGAWTVEAPSIGGLFDAGTAATYLSKTASAWASGATELAERCAMLQARTIDESSPARAVDAILALTGEASLAQSNRAAVPATPDLRAALSIRVDSTPKYVLAGRFSFMGGYGSIIKNYEAALRSVGGEHVCFDTLRGEITGSGNGDFWTYDSATRTMSVSGAAVVIACDVAPQFRNISVAGKAALAGCTLFETHSIPATWLPPLRTVDEVWVPTDFNMRTFAYAGVAESKLRKVPYCLDAQYFGRQTEPLDLGAVRGTKLLYVMANFSRKDLGLLLRAYLQEFGARDDVSLIIKIFSSTEAAYRQIEEAVGPGFRLGESDQAHIKVLQGSMTDDQLRALYVASDVYVSTERAKGWDYPAMEALSAGKPVVAIDWSGSTEFLTQDNAFLIPAGELVSSDPTIVVNAQLYLGQAYPDVLEADVRAALRRAVDDKAGRRLRGEQGRADVRRSYDLPVVGAELLKIARSFGPMSFHDTSDAEIRILPFDSVAAGSGQVKR